MSYIIYICIKTGMSEKRETLLLPTRWCRQLNKDGLHSASNSVACCQRADCFSGVATAPGAAPSSVAAGSDISLTHTHTESK